MQAEGTQDGRRARVTIRQVAEQAGVSIATVSRVVNGHSDVSSQTREAVTRVLRERGYPGSPRARQGQDRTGLIGVTMPLVHPGYFASILSGAAEALYEHDMRVVLCPTQHSRAREVSLLDRLAHGETDGAILVLPEESSAEMSALASHGYRFVVVDPLREVAMGVPVVSSANSSGATQAALEQDPGASVYLDGTHSAWQSVGTITQRLLSAGVQQAQGVFLDVSNYQPTPELIDYGTWISDCIAMVTDPNNAFFNNPSACASQYYPATQSDFSTWGLTTAWYAQNMGDAVASTHFVIDTSRNGNGPNNMQAFANAPYNQPPSVISTLASGNWCNPPGAGLGLRPTANTGTPLLDAYLWVKIPGESDGQCDAAGGVRAWDYTDYTQPGWPTTAAQQQLFDPLWGMNDPAAGTWFPQQALQLAQDANPAR